VTRRLRPARLLTMVLVLGACASSVASPAAPAPGTLPPIATTVPGAAARTSVPRGAAADAATIATRPATTAATTTVAPTTTTTPVTTTTRPTTTPYVLPVPADVKISYAHVHGGYPATDIFASSGCGTPLLSPVDGRVLQVRRVDNWTKQENNPALRGGLSVAILGDDGVRYYLAHLQEIDDAIQPGADVTAGQRLGEMGETGDAGACHVHFGISLPCPGLEWSVRRGVVWPWPYLDSWRGGGQSSPQEEIATWSSEHPDACAAAMDDSDAASSG
jgi:murein DD-endopeptidase MepM/ murein hydrolase activator NlpD